MRYDGKYADQNRDLAIQLNTNKFVDGSAIVCQGDTIIHVAVKISDVKLGGKMPNFTTHVYYPESGTNHYDKIDEKKNSLKQLVDKCLSTVLHFPSRNTVHFDVVLIVQQDDGSLNASAINGLYLALQQAIDYRSMKAGSLPVILKETFAAITYASLSEGKFAIDPDSKEEEQATFLATLIMTESGEFIDLIIDNKTSTFTVNRINEVVAIGQTALENQLVQLVDYLYADYSADVDDKTIVIATNNSGKAKEFEALFKTRGYKIKTLKDFPDLPDVAETGNTFAENASLKAETIASVLKMPVLADDSGLKVDALGGLPGVHSARFAGTQKSDAANNAKLIHELTDIPDEKRTAQFHCTLAFALPGKETLLVESDWPGTIGRIPRGENGFGYDPLFIDSRTGKTSAELLPEEKNKISHRSQAIQKLSNVWENWLEGDH